MPKPKTVSKLKQEAATLLQKLVRMKYADDNGMCERVTCGKVDLYKYMDGGLLLAEDITPRC